MRIPSRYPRETNSTDKWGKYLSNRRKTGRVTVFGTESENISTQQIKVERLMNQLGVQVTRAQLTEQPSIRLRIRRSPGRTKGGGET